MSDSILKHLKALDRRTNDLCEMQLVNLHLAKRGLRLATKGEPYHKVLVKLSDWPERRVMKVRPLPREEVSTRILKRM